MQVLNIFHVLIAIAMVAFILIQRGPGATAGAAFGSGASGTVFGSRGAGSFLTRTTWILATLFCLISLTMAVVVSRTTAEPQTDLGVIGQTAPAQPTAPSIEDLPGVQPPAGESDLPAADLMDAVDSSVPDTGDLPAIEPGEAPAEPDEGGDDR